MEKRLVLYIKKMYIKNISQRLILLNKLIIKIADYICQNEEVVRKGIGKVIGGKVFELESERLRAEGEERLSILINRLILDGRSIEIQAVVTNAEIQKQLYKEYGM